jgi:hypothetical protein
MPQEVSLIPFEYAFNILNPKSYVKDITQTYQVIPTYVWEVHNK